MYTFAAGDESVTLRPENTAPVVRAFVEHALHRTIAADPHVFALRWYESRNPAPFPGSEGAARDPRIDDAEREVAACSGKKPDLRPLTRWNLRAGRRSCSSSMPSRPGTEPSSRACVCHLAADQDVTPGYRHLDRMLRFLQCRRRARRAGESAGC
jgi:hypothetical protein